ncbi:MAG: hypothetical protein ACO4CT_14170 [Planctomycetota bacterium]
MVKPDRLSSAIEWSRLRMQPFRERRMAAIRQYLGAHYGMGGDRMPLNMVELAIGIFRRELAARNPGVIVKSRSRELSPVAKKLELAVNHVLKEMDLARTLQEVVFDAIFSMGVVKIGVTEVDGARGFRHDGDLPFVDPVLLDDLVLDMRASRWEAQQFIGNRYVLPFEVAKKSKLYNLRGKSPTRPTPWNETGDTRQSTLSTQGLMDEDAELMPTIEMWDIWLPMEGKVCTYTADDSGKIECDRPVREVDWDGPEEGPYLALGLGELSGNLMPIPPINSLLDMNDAINRSFRKLVRQVDRSKSVTMVAGGADEDGNRIVECDDGDVIRVDRPESIQQVTFGGVDQPTLAFTLQMRDLFSYAAGNLDAMGGLSNSADTLGQEQIIQASSSQKIRDYQARMLTFTRRIVRHVASYVFHDPETKWQIMLPLSERGIEIPLEFSPEEREEDDFLEMEFDIAPASMQDPSNVQRVEMMSKVVTQYLAPLMPAMQQQGTTIDVSAFVREMADLTNTPELKDLVVPAQMAQDSVAQNVQGEGVGATPAKSPITTRRYERVNRSTGGTRASRDNMAVRALSGSELTPQENDAMSKPYS